MVGFTSMIRPEPLALEIIAASVPEHEVRILDMRLDRALEETLRESGPDLIGVTGYTNDVPGMLRVFDTAKRLKPEAVTVAGGYHATLVPEDLYAPAVDVIVKGEGEITFRELVSAIEDGRSFARIPGIIYRRKDKRVHTRTRPLVRRLDDLPFPNRALTAQYRSQYHFHFWDNPYLVETGRGCPFRCTFCAVWKFHRGKCRFRSSERVFEELKDLNQRVVCFVDDNFLADIRRVDRLADMLLSAGVHVHSWCQMRADSVVRHPEVVRKWAQVGLQSTLVGFESFRDEDLESVNKSSSIRINEQAMQILSNNGVDMWGAFIVDPQWTRLDFDALIDYVRSKKISFPTFTILTPLPGTQFFQEKLKDLTTHNYELFDFLHTVLPTKLPLEEFYANMARLYASTTLGLSELKKRIRAGQIPVSSLGRIREVLCDVTNPQAYLQNTATS
jgi:radical SAM superfamily enzyme YgiQ (UPF0313 family)